MPTTFANIETVAFMRAFLSVPKPMFFRGHTGPTIEPLPRLFRPAFRTRTRPYDRFGITTFEAHTADRFRRDAIQIDCAGDLPAPTDLVEWLAVMQHHDLPTRLLNWTLNPYYALYFAVRDAALIPGEPATNGELWVLVPEKLNERSIGVTRVVDASHPRVEDYAARAFAGEWMRPHSDPPVYPVAFRMEARIPRFAAQDTAFTIHPTPVLDFESESYISAVFPDDSAGEMYGRYIVPAARKREIVRELVGMGITEASMYRDLDALARSCVADLELSPPDRRMWHVPFPRP